MAHEDGTVVADELLPVAEACGQTAEQVRSCLRRLVREGLFQREGTGRNAKYLATKDGLEALGSNMERHRLAYVQDHAGRGQHLDVAMLAAGLWRYWLQGPIVTAIILEDRTPSRSQDTDFGDQSKALHPIFEAWFYPAQHLVDLGYTVENTWASSTAASKTCRRKSGRALARRIVSLPTVIWRS